MNKKIKLSCLGQMRLIYEQILRYQPTKPIYTNDFRTALQNAIHINNQNQTSKIVLQQSFCNKQLNNLITNIKNSKWGQQYNKHLLLSLIPKTFKYWQLLQKENIQPFYVYKLNFIDYAQVYKLFNQIIIQPYKDIINENVQLFITNCGNDNGILLPFYNNLFLFLLNTNKFSDNTISHQLMHYFQYTLKIKITPAVQISYKQIQNINFLGLDASYIIYLFDEKQFIPHINDFCNNFISLYQKFYRNISISQFKKQFLNYIKTMDQFYNLHQLFQNYLEIDVDVSGLYTFILSIKLNKNKQLSMNLLQEYITKYKGI